MKYKEFLQESQEENINFLKKKQSQYQGFDVISNMKTSYCGIYKITNKINGKVYIGKSVACKKRWRDHKNNTSKTSTPFGNAIRKYGWENFELEIIEHMDRDDDLLYEREIYWISYYNSTDDRFGYNLSCGGAGGLQGTIWSEKTRQKMLPILHRRAENRRGIKLSKEVCKNISDSLKGKYTGEDNPFYGKHHTEEAKRKLSEKASIRNKGEGNPMFGKPKSELCINRIKEANSKKIEQINKVTGDLIKIWDSTADAARFFQCTKTPINSCLKGRSKSSCGFFWRYHLV